MRLGVAIEETWDFFHEIYADLEERYEVDLFQRREVSMPVFRERINRQRFNRDMRQFLVRNDIAFFEWASELLVAASHMPKTAGIVTRLHRYEMYKWADSVNWDNVDAVILVSRAKRDEFASRFPEHAAKAVVIPEAVSLQRFTVQEREFRGDIGTMCHLRPRKRVYDLIVTFAEMLGDGHDLHLHIAGGRAEGFAEYDVAVHSLVERLGIRDHVTFYGHVEQAEEWYRNIDIFVSNSYSEGLQVTPLEAIASGCYCLSHHWDGAEDLFSVSDLFLTNCELKDKVRAFCRLEEAEREAERCRQRTALIERCDVDQTKVQIRQVIERVAAKSQVARE